MIGHRGDPTNYPEETFQSFDSAFNQGADYVEFDIHESRDGQLFVQHDDSLQRMTGANRLISQSTSQQIQQYHTKNGEPVHSLAEIFSHYQTGSQKFLIETKISSDEPHPNLEAKLVALIHQYHMDKRVMFHSFSLASLKRLQQLAPDIPRIFIVGSLKRITFAVFPYVTGVNISSELINQKLVDDLHYIGQKVYIWDEMNENRALWNWLVNLNIDGVVTNYPGLGADFKHLKAKATITPLDDLATNTSQSTLPVYMNPYQPTLKAKQIKPDEAVTVIGQVIVQGQTYYRIGQNAFVPAETINLAPQAGWASLFSRQRVQVRQPLMAANLYNNPLNPTRVSGHLANTQAVPVSGVRIHNNRLWLQVPGGWVQGQDVQLPAANHSALWLYQYNQMPKPLRMKLVLPEFPF
ncbi:glycerophosphoryl diester phosphodiesterase [Lacticaseibacillus brantae DSM 23927]|uniref:Glycerophosphoryl diester phosphodiesterase n=1 Tax=Lacticaseibacillus brantae DSM 23927 TaxID=1423727 RepID=A0A0R2AYE5_9LACO|nr:glycerophosphoryl diester phosphodiesterase [Lacticaseibacillus brantae DSM 23927]